MAASISKENADFLAERSDEMGIAISHLVDDIVSAYRGFPTVIEVLKHLKRLPELEKKLDSICTRLDSFSTGSPEQKQNPY